MARIVTTRNAVLTELSEHLERLDAHLEAAKAEPWKRKEHLDAVEGALMRAHFALKMLPDVIEPNETYVTDAALGFIDDFPWRLDIRVGSQELRGIVPTVERALTILRERPFREWRYAGGTGEHARLNVHLRSELEARIQALREEADRLERELKA